MEPQIFPPHEISKIIFNQVPPHGLIKSRSVSKDWNKWVKQDEASFLLETIYKSAKEYFDGNMSIVKYFGSIGSDETTSCCNSFYVRIQNNPNHNPPFSFFNYLESPTLGERCKIVGANIGAVSKALFKTMFSDPFFELHQTERAIEKNHHCIDVNTSYEKDNVARKIKQAKLSYIGGPKLGLKSIPLKNHLQNRVNQYFENHNIVIPIKC